MFQQAQAESKSSMALLTQRIDTLTSTQTQTQQTAQTVVESQRALADAQKIASLQSELEAAQAEIASLKSGLKEAKKKASLEITALKEQRATDAPIIERYAECCMELCADVAAKCMTAKPKGTLTYSGILKHAIDATSSNQCCEILSSTYWPQDDVTTMVTTGMASSISKRWDILAKAGLHREAVVNIKSLYGPYSLLSMPTSMHEKVMLALERMNIDVVAAEEAKVTHLPGLSEGGKATQAKQVACRLNRSMAAQVSHQRYTLVSQLCQIAGDLELPISSQEEVEDMARKGTWCKQRQTGPAQPNHQQLARQQQQSQQLSQSQQSHSCHHSQMTRNQSASRVSPAAAELPAQLPRTPSLPLPSPEELLQQVTSPQLPPLQHSAVSNTQVELALPAH
ncbi:hypothetical protein FBU31_000310 [Coemansia sp. 'formosensis']|nr:hypothetical protein FBU31_000310 [Coemansia sp. 'formosensis']